MTQIKKRFDPPLETLRDVLDALTSILVAPIPEDYQVRFGVTIRGKVREVTVIYGDHR